MADQYVISPTEFFTNTLGTKTADYNRQYLFKVFFNKQMPGVEVPFITYFVAATQSPVETTGIINVDWMNSQVKLGGRTLYEPWSVTVRDDASSVAYRYFKEWRKLVYQPSGVAGGQANIPRDYKASLDLQLLDNRGVPSRGYKLQGAWPGSIGQITLEYATEGIVTFPVSINFDDFIPTPE
jgi:hypothetical protein